MYINVQYMYIYTYTCPCSWSPDGQIFKLSPRTTKSAFELSSASAGPPHALAAGVHCWLVRAKKHLL